MITVWDVPGCLKHFQFYNEYSLKVSRFNPPGNLPNNVDKKMFRKWASN